MPSQESGRIKAGNPHWYFQGKVNFTHFLSQKKLTKKTWAPLITGTGACAGASLLVIFAKDYLPFLTRRAIDVFGGLCIAVWAKDELCYHFRAALKRRPSSSSFWHVHVRAVRILLFIIDNVQGLVSACFARPAFYS